MYVYIYVLNEKKSVLHINWLAQLLPSSLLIDPEWRGWSRLLVLESRYPFIAGTQCERLIPYESLIKSLGPSSFWLNNMDLSPNRPRPSYIHQWLTSGMQSSFPSRLFSAATTSAEATHRFPEVLVVGMGMTRMKLWIFSPFLQKGNIIFKSADSQQEGKPTQITGVLVDGHY